jgi:hypothetical protein
MRLPFGCWFPTGFQLAKQGHVLHVAGIENWLGWHPSRWLVALANNLQGHIAYHSLQNFLCSSITAMAPLHLIIQD